MYTLPNQFTLVNLNKMSKHRYWVHRREKNSNSNLCFSSSYTVSLWHQNLMLLLVFLPSITLGQSTERLHLEPVLEKRKYCKYLMINIYNSYPMWWIMHCLVGFDEYLSLLLIALFPTSSRWLMSCMWREMLKKHQIQTEYVSLRTQYSFQSNRVTYESLEQQFVYINYYIHIKYKVAYTV